MLVIGFPPQDAPGGLLWMSSSSEVEHGGGAEGHQIYFILNCHLYANSTLSTPSAPIIGLSSLDFGGLINKYEVWVTSMSS